MSPIGGIQDESAQAKNTGQAVGKKAKLAGKVGKKAKFDKAIIKYCLLMLFLGLVMGTNVFIDFYSTVSVNLLKVTWIGSAMIYALIGWGHTIWMYKRVDWTSRDSFLKEFLVTLLSAVLLFLGSLMLGAILGQFDLFTEFPLKFRLIIGSAVICFILPFAFQYSYSKSLEIQSPAYRLWGFPERVREPNHKWNPDRIVFANLKFTKQMNQGASTTVKARLPQEAILGDLVYLFLTDYNQNRSPQSPVVDLRNEENTLGWLFYVPKSFGRKTVLDPGETIEANNVQEDSTIVLERKLKADLN